MRAAPAVLMLALSASPAFAQGWRLPEIVVPGRPDVPVLIDGVDVSWSIIESDFGLDRPIGLTPIVVYRPFVVTPRYSVRRPFVYRASVAPGPHYFPSSGERPRYGRLEVVPPPDRSLPAPAPSYRQGWSSRSSDGPATDYSSFAQPGSFADHGRRLWRRKRSTKPQLSEPDRAAAEPHRVEGDADPQNPQPRGLPQ
jgi:hypothetical protein